MLKVLIICVSCLVSSLVSQRAFGQRHYAGVHGIECNYGLNVFGRSNTFLNISVSKYTTRMTHWKLGLNYFEKSYDYHYEDPSLLDSQNTTVYSTAKDYYLDGVYSRTVATNLSNLYLNLGIGAFTGAEAFKSDEGKKYDFLLGPKIEVETEIYLLPKVALIGRLMQHWSPFSGIAEWNTVWNVGVKVLIY